jgi:topoisomerase-4 subunit A
MKDKSLEIISHGEGDDKVLTLNGMYQNYFLDYASYVILERAVPAIEDGLKPVQRRILHSMKEMDDGRYHKVANIIGQTMQFHPHGDAAIGDALVNLGQKDLLIDTQGNWGDVRTGDRAAAARYIEARLTKFALEVAFNGDTTEWQVSYDGRKREPINLPMKFPLLLAQGIEGIAVGLSTKLLPHNFVELIKASIQVLKGKKPELYPDFQTGGYVDVRDYQDGHRGGKVRVRAKIYKIDNKSLAIRELPYGVTTETLIESIVKANEKGKIKIKKVVDNTAKDVEVAIELQPGVSPDVTIDALYAFSDCEVGISPNACVIIDNKPHFLTVSECLRISTENTKELLRMELEIKKAELEEKWHFVSLEKIFIENRIYHEIEECESWEEVMTTIDRELKKYTVTPSMEVVKGDKRIRLMRDITDDDITRLTEIRIKRISKYNKFAADELLANLEKEIEQVKHDLANLTDFAIAYFEELLRKYGKGRERRTEIAIFDNIQASKVVANNAKLYVNRADGFIGMGLKKDEFVCDCSDIDDIIVFRKDGKFQVVRASDKSFVGKDIIHVAVWNKADERTTYNMVYTDGKEGTAYVKRFNVTAITRDKEYDLTKGNPNSKLLYFSANPNGEAEVINIKLSQGCKAKIKVFDYDFSELEIKGRGSQGNILTKYPVVKVSQKEAGKSTLGARQIWFDDITARLNTDGRGRLLGEFDTGDCILVLNLDGTYEMTDYELTNRYEMKNIAYLGKFIPDQIINALHFDGNKGWTMVKRFKIETSKLNEKFSYLSDHKNSKLLHVSVAESPRLQYSIKLNGKKMSGELNPSEFVDVKGWKAMGNRVSDQLLTNIKEIETSIIEEKKSLKAGDSIDLEITNGQGALFD